MADCSYSRCIQQKRNIRRELQRWTKNMVYIVGLERIAEELMGRRKWKLYQDSMSRNYLQPLNNNVKKNEEIHKEDLDSKNEHDKTEKEEKPNSISENIKVEVKEEDTTKDQEVDDRLKDWSPQSKCYFCVDGKLDSDHTNHGGLSPRNTDSDSSDSPSDTETPPTLTPTVGLLNNHRKMTTIENIAANIAAVAALTPGPAVPHIPYYHQSLIPSQWYLPNVTRNYTERLDMEKTGEQPLDLSSKAGNNNASSMENKVPTNMRLPTLDTKHIFNSDFRAKPRMPTVAGRRTYTEDELQAALRDIQSGKLGTRRAAVIYGIPRSTLRNKVYKLALERERESHLNTAPLKIEEEEAMEDDKELSGAEEEKEVEKALQGPLLTVDDIRRLSNIESPEALQSLLKGKEEILFGLDHSAVGPYIQNLLVQSGGILPGQKPVETDVNPLLREVLKKIIVDDKVKTHQNNGENEKLTRPSPSNSVIMRNDKIKSESDMETEETPSNVILKIPSFKPTTSKNGCDLYRSPIESGSLVSPPVTSESGSPPIMPTKMSLKEVKDAIAKTITHKFQSSPDPIRHQMMDMDFKRSGFTPPLGGISVIKTQPDISRPPYQPQNKPQQTSNTTTSQGGKGTRPKRGKYRNYDRDSLVEAVRAVQRGEMSVHRAGSYYGVPHSTLEYKVKERHLMRPRKRDPKPNPVDEKIASLKQNDIRNAADKLKPVIKPPQKFPPTSPNGMKIPLFDPNAVACWGGTQAPFPFWPHPGYSHIPLDYGRTSTSAFPTNPEQYFASQMMQKLQEESRTHSNTTTPSTTPNSTSTPALAKNTRQIAESLLDAGANGSFLDGIIRSSLESGVPINEEKSAKEDKNVAPENMSNKALLDQLCRNSRLTPLPKISEPNSSSDESFRKGPSPIAFTSGNSRDEQRSESSPKRGSEIHTIELSNDSNDASDHKSKEEEPRTTPGRIYLKTELTKPENLKPEMLVRFRDVLTDVERNGIGESTTGSASDTDAAQD